MCFGKLHFTEIPKLLFAHSFSTRQYVHKIHTSNVLEVTYIDAGAISASVNGKPFCAAAGDILVSPPDSEISVTLQQQGEHHAHSTVAVYSEENAEFCSSQDILNCKYVHQENSVPPEYKNFFVFPLHCTVTDSRIPDKIKEIIRQSKTSPVSNNLYLGGLVLELLYFLSQESFSLVEKDFESYVPPSSLFYCKTITDYILTHYHEEIRLDALASLVQLNKNYMCALFKDTMHQTIMNYTIHVRLNHAKELLTSTDLSVSKVAEAVGIENEAYFSRLFTKYEKISPKQFRTHVIGSV